MAYGVPTTGKASPRDLDGWCSPLKIGFAAPISLKLLSHHVDGSDEVPDGYSFPPMSMLVEELLQRGHCVSVFALDPTTHAPRTFRGDQLTIHIGRYRPRHRARDYFAVERTDLSAAMASDPCDVIHAHWTYEFALAALASGQPNVITAHDAPLRVLQLNPIPYRFVRTVMAYHVANKATLLTAVSPYLADHFRKYLFYHNPIHVVPNALPNWLFNMAAGRKFSDSRTITFATVLTGWGGQKNGHTALQAFQMVRGKLPNARLMMFGQGHSEHEEGFVWASNQGLSDGVEFIGRLPYEQLHRQLADEVDILLHPALEESFCMAIAEAMALGIPVIGGRNSGAVPHTLQDGACGLLTDVRSAGMMADAMLELAGSATLRTRLGESGRSVAREHFNIHAVVDAYERIYSQAVSASVH